MTARERILAALNHQEPDSIPVDLGGTTATTMTIGAYKKLRIALELPATPLKLASVTSQLVDIDSDVLQHLAVDTRGVFPSAGRSWEFNPKEQDGHETFVDEWGIGFRRSIGDSERYFDMCFHPLADVKDIHTLENYPFPEGDDLFRIDGIREECERIRQAGYPVIFGHPIGNGILHTGTRLMGYGEYYTRLLLQPGFIEGLNERILEVKIQFWDMVLSQLGDLLDIVYEMDDLGTQNGPLLSPRSYRKQIKPFTAQLFAFIKKKAPHIKILFHSCGSVVEFIPDFIEMGVDALNPVQTTAKGMELKKLKKEFGQDIAFWGGGIDTQTILPAGTPEQVKADVCKRIRDLSPGGGFVFATIHNIQSNVPPENILAIFEALQEFRPVQLASPSLGGSCS